MNDDCVTLPSTEALLADHLDGLRQHLRSRLPSDADADDLSQEACLRMLQAKRTDAIRYPKAYLYRIAHNLLHNYYTGRRIAVDDGVAPEDLASQGLTLDELTCLHTRRRMIDKAMCELSHKCQLVIHLRWREGRSVKEIAEHMRLSPGMVKKYLARSVAHFRKRLGCSAAATLRHGPGT